MRDGRFTPEDLEACPELRDILDALLRGDRIVFYRTSEDAEVAEAMATLDDDLTALGG